MAGLLSIVCTPIGNLEDVSKRVVRVLSEADLILVESVDNALKLLRLINIPLEGKKVLSCAQQEEESRVKVVLERLRDGDRVALISDAGAPSVSDPGGRIVEAVAQSEYALEVIPGPSALVAALMGAGLMTNRFAFLGFLPKKGKEREKLVVEARNAGLALVIYESPMRIVDTLEDLANWCGFARVVVARELTKRFETFHRGVLGSPLTPELVEKGEMVIVVEEGGLAEHLSVVVDEKSELERVRALIESGEISTKDASKQLAKVLNISSRSAYEKLVSGR